jgi:hypothetical protein
MKCKQKRWGMVQETKHLHSIHKGYSPVYKKKKEEEEEDKEEEEVKEEEEDE